MKIRRRKRHKTAIAWTLLAAFLFVFLVKDFHSHTTCHHECMHNEQQPEDRQDEHDSCLICHFLFSPFVVYDDPVSFEKEIFCTYPVVPPKEKPVLSYLSLRLRAPPSVF